MRWLRLVLFGILLFFPLRWCSEFFLDAMPALVRVAFFGHRLNAFELSMLSASASSRPAQDTAEPPHRESWFVLRSHADWLFVLLAAAALLFFFFVKRNRGLLAGMGLTLLAHRALVHMAFRALYGRHLSLSGALAASFYFFFFCLGLRWIAAASGEASFRLRVLHPLLLVGVPLTLFYGALAVIFRDGLGLWLGVLLAPVLLSSILASLWPAPRCSQPDPPVSPGGKAVGAGAAALLLFTAGLYGGSRAIARTKARAAQEILDSLPPAPADAPYTKLFFQKGVNFTAEFGEVYGSPGSLEMLKRLPAYGVNAVALVPYGSASRKEPLIHRWENGWERDDGVRQLSRLAHSLGMKVLLKPQLWVEPGNPSDLDFARSEDRAKWFAAYGEFLEHYARLATEIHADVLCIGVEFEKMSSYDVDWRRLIARARALYPGALTYAANYGPEFESVTFWDALDYIGLDEYYPLPDDLSAEEVLLRVAAVQQKFSRPVLFTEAGFASAEATNRQPWDDPQAKPDPDLQARAYESLFRAFYGKPWFKGVYWWKVGTNGYGGPDDASHTPWRKPAMDVLRRWYTGTVSRHSD